MCVHTYMCIYRVTVCKSICMLQTYAFVCTSVYHVTKNIGFILQRRQKDEDEVELEQLVQLMATTRQRPRPNTQQENSSLSNVANAPTPVSW